MRTLGNTAYVACLPLLCQDRLTSIVSTDVSATSWFSFMPGCTWRTWVARKLRLKSMMHDLKLACTAVLPDITIIDEIPFMRKLNLLHPKWKEKQNTVMNEWINECWDKPTFCMPTTLAFETFSPSLTRCTQLAIWLSSYHWSIYGLIKCYGWELIQDECTRISINKAPNQDKIYQDLI